MLLAQFNQPANNSFLLSDCVTFAQLAFSQNALEVDDRFWHVLRPEHALVVWDLRFRFLFGCPKFMDSTGFDLITLRTSYWPNLHERSILHRKQLENGFQLAVKTHQPQFDVTPAHLIKEIGTTRKMQCVASVKAMFPLSINGKPACIAAVVDVELLQANS